MIKLVQKFQIMKDSSAGNNGVEGEAMKAKWIQDYDMRTDRIYARPGCPKCDAPIGREEDGTYLCYSCGKEVKVDDADMLRWFALRRATRTELEDDALGCGGKKCMETVYVRNPVTMKWQPAYGKCKQCGAKFIV